jgi:uncharacterized membrane protein
MAAAVGNFTILQLVSASPADAPVLGKVPPRLARAGQVGLAVLWITGPIMLWLLPGGPAAWPWAFWVKLLCVILLTADVIMLDLLLRRIQAGDEAARARLPVYGRISGALLALVVIFAVIAFR